MILTQAQYETVVGLAGLTILYNTAANVATLMQSGGSSSVNGLTGPITLAGLGGVTIGVSGQTINISAPAGALPVSGPAGSFLQNTDGYGTLAWTTVSTTTGNLTSSYGPLTITGGTGATLSNASITLQVANTIQDGYLTSTDWNTFNNKANSGANSNITSLAGLTIALSVLQGGTGVTTLTLNGVLYGNGTSPVGVTAAGTTGQVLTATTGSAPTWITPGVGGTVTSVTSAYGPLTISNPTTTPVITLQVATTTQDGYLISTDWNTFNNKQSAGNYITDLTGDVTASGPGSASATVNSVGTSSAADINTAELAANAATSSNTPSTIVERDGSGDFSAGTITADLTGTASGNPPNSRLIDTLAPLVGGGDLSADRTLSITQSTTSTDGYLTSTDWNTFNNKFDSINALTGAVTVTGAGGVIVGTAGQTITITAPAGTLPAGGSPAGTPALGTARDYAILAASAVTGSTGAGSTLTGNLGISPGTSITNFPPSTYTGSLDVANGAASTAQSSASTAYADLSTRSSTTIATALDGQSLSPGVYSSASGTFTLDGGGPLTLTGNGVYVFQTASTLITGSSGVPVITLAGSATSANIYWVVGSSATLNSGFSGTFYGNVIAQASITVTLGGTVNGSLIALTAAVTLSATTAINVGAVGPSVVAGSFLQNTDGYGTLAWASPFTSGTTGSRPSTTVVGYMFFDTTLGQPIWWDGTVWVDATGTTV